MKKYILSLLIIYLCCPVWGQEMQEEPPYRRNALYSILIHHPSREFGGEIRNVFLGIPIPEKFDNHDLSVKVINTDEKKEDELQIRNFLEKNAIARRMVSKWFNRDPQTGICDMQLISNRGLYDATYFDVELSKMSQRGTAILADAGEELIHHTFVIVNDIRYRDRQKGAKVFGVLAKAAGVGLAVAFNNADIMDLGDNLGDLISKIKGFSVTVTSYLYQLDWDEDTANTFYNQYYMDSQLVDENKRMAFNNNKNLFKLKYIGSQSVSSGKTSMEGINVETPEVMIRKVCTRAIDESIVKLQKEHETFRVKTPIFTLEPTITAKIGLKEGVSEDSKYEVLEQEMDSKGRTRYKQLGIIKPIKGKVWDNRYMASDENAYGAGFEVTTFRKVSGGKFQPGMLIREIK